MKLSGKLLSLILALAIMAGTVIVISSEKTETENFSLTESNHDEAVEFLGLLKIYNGDGTGSAANELVKRWHMALLVSRMTTGITDDSVWAEAENTTPFTDIGAEHYIGAIACAYKAGMILGVGGNMFAPEQSITYEDALTMVVRALGYNNLSYPYGYIQKAEELGLAKNLDELRDRPKQPISRGQTAEIILNALYANAKSKTTFAKSVFGLSSEMTTVTIIATCNQALEDMEKPSEASVVVEFEDKTRKTYPESYFALSGESADDILGYRFRVATQDNFATFCAAKKCASVTAYNYGEARNEIKRVANSANKAEIFGKVYTLGEDIKIYNAYAGYRAYKYKFDKNGNILKSGGDIGLYYNGGNYYTDAGCTVPATDAELASYIQELNINFCTGVYEEITVAAEMTLGKFSELVLFDDNGDGKYDRAIYTPYAIGKYYEITKDGTTYPSLYYNDGCHILKDARGRNIQKSEIDFRGVPTSGADGKTVIYKFNRYAKTFEFVEVLPSVNVNSEPSKPSEEKYTAFAVFDREKDVKTVDENGNIILDAYVDGSGIKKEIKVCALDGIAVSEYTKGLFTSNIYGAAVNPNGTYSLSSSVEYIEKTEKTGADVSFKYGITDAAMSVEAKDKIATNVRFKTAFSSVFMFVGNDGVKVYTGVPQDGWKIKLSDENVTLYRALDNFVLAVSRGNLADIVGEGEFVSDETPLQTECYIIVKNTVLDRVTETEKSGEFLYTYKNLYDTVSGKFVTRTFASGETAPIYLAVGAAYKNENGTLCKLDADTLFSEYKKDTFASNGDVDNDTTGYVVQMQKSGRCIFGDIYVVWLKEDGTVAVFDAKSAVAKKAIVGYTVYYKVDVVGNMTGYAVKLD